MLEKIQQIINEFGLKLKKVYGVSVCSLDIVDLGQQKYIVTGALLTPKQRDSFIKAIVALGGDIQLEIKALTEEEPQYGWGYVEMVPVNVWYRTLVEDQMPYLATQIVVKDEPLKLLWQTEEFFCLQQIDGTIGWVRKKYIQRYPGLPDWQPPEQKSSNKVDIVAYLERWIGTPYLRGGMTQKGVDCSGLVQNIYRHSFNYLLPRHSMDQMQQGAEVSEYKLGNLCFFEKVQPSGKTIGHVAMMVYPEDKKVIHANLVNGKVQYNTLAEMTTMGYKLLTIHTYPIEIF